MRTLDQPLAHARSRSSGALVLTGEPGIGNGNGVRTARSPTTFPQRQDIEMHLGLCNNIGIHSTDPTPNYLRDHALT
ncbi:hypothetical protein [Rhodococcus opacus]|uniref:hypothetical protein n=1 Tax=Rhodococcus opacus TaxID=37919 RepID=UPI0029558AF3|nr:hypothetical protein [Rhodococcus opacus]MDV7088628.1 hypothetical protein [Rhodococcus opacus]